MKGYWDVFAITFVAIVMITSSIVPVLAAQGVVTKINRPQTHGTIDRTDDGSNNDYQFQIPQSYCNGNEIIPPLEVNEEVNFTFDPEPSRVAKDVTRASEPPCDPPGEGDGIINILHDLLKLIFQ